MKFVLGNLNCEFQPGSAMEVGLEKRKGTEVKLVNSTLTLVRNSFQKKQYVAKFANKNKGL